MMQLSEQEQVRREALQAIRDLGFNPYPPEKFDVNAHASEVKADFEESEEEKEGIVLAGRLMSRRIMGKASFAELQDSSGRIQLYLNRDEICPGENKDLYNKVFKKLLDIGDIIGVKGRVFSTRTGETTLHVEELTVLAKSLRPLPIVKTDAEGNTYDAFTDPEQRHRMRYVDLTVNTERRKVFEDRAALINSMRKYFNAQDWLEVETPILQPIHGGAAARPFKTHHNTLDIPLYLRIANELYLKRLIVGGFDGVYEFGKMFRNEGMDRTHNPEFTSMEMYVAYKDYHWMMDMVEDMLEKTVLEVKGKTQIATADQQIDFKGPYPRIPLLEAVEQYGGKSVQELDIDGWRSYAKELHIEVDASMGKGKLIDEVFGEIVEPKLIQPTFITDYPLEMTPLAKKHRSKEGLVERFELFVNGKEIANAYTELNDPIDQRERFEQQLALAQAGDEEAMVLDEDFLKALEYGMPPTSGLGIGIDRLTMLIAGQTSIQEVLFFPQMRPQPTTEASEGEEKESEG